MFPRDLVSVMVREIGFLLSVLDIPLALIGIRRFHRRLAVLVL